MKIAGQRIKGLVVKTLASGAVYYGWEPTPKERKAGWKTTKLAAATLEEAIALCKAHNAKLAEWRTGGARKAAIATITRRATVDDVIALYKKEGYPRIKQGGRAGGDRFIAESTRREYDYKFRAISKWAGKEPFAAITTANVEKFRDALLTPNEAGEVRLTLAHATLRVARTLGAYAEKKHVIAKGANPFTDFDLGAPPPRQQVWSAPARAAIEAEAVRAGEPSLALTIALAPFISQRQGDMLRLVTTAYREIPEFKLQPETFALLSRPPLSPDGRVMGITLRQQKTKVWIEMPVFGDLRARIEAELLKRRTAGVATLFVDDRNGRPWDRKYGQTIFQRRFKETRDAAASRAREAGETALANELDGLQFRDYRRTGVVMLGELGLPDQWIAAITGHDLDETREILETYMPRNTAMAGAGIAALAVRTGQAAPADNEDKEKRA